MNPKVQYVVVNKSNIHVSYVMYYINKLFIRSQLSRSEPDLYLNEQAGTYEQVKYLNRMWAVQKSTCSIPAASRQQTSTRDVDFIVEQIVFRVTLH